MLFRRKMPRACSYCLWGTKFSDDQMLCRKHGVVSSNYACRKFTYDPCKRIPPRRSGLNFLKYDKEDFSL